MTQNVFAISNQWRQVSIKDLLEGVTLTIKLRTLFDGEHQGSVTAIIGRKKLPAIVIRAIIADIETRTIGAIVNSTCW